LSTHVQAYGVQLERPVVYPDTMAPIIKLDDNGARTPQYDALGLPAAT
jgi:hypothetical protein